MSNSGNSNANVDEQAARQIDLISQFLDRTKNALESGYTDMAVDHIFLQVGLKATAKA